MHKNHELSGEAKNKSENKENAKKSPWDALMDYYEKGKRERVERLKSEIENASTDEINENGWYPQDEVLERFSREQILASPSALRKIGRSALRVFGIRLQRSERLQDREAMGAAISTFEQDKIIQDQLESARRETAVSVRKIMDEEERARLERQKLENNMINARAVFETNKIYRFRDERAQELLERDLNNRLLTVDALEEMSFPDNPELAKRSLEYDGAEVTVYDLKGMPFGMLTHAVDYRRNNNAGEIGTETFRRVLEDPSVWVQSENEAMDENGYGTRNDDARGNVISASYTNSESNIDSKVGGANWSGEPYLCYGFSKVEGGGLLLTAGGDAGTSNYVDTRAFNPLRATNIDALDLVESGDRGFGYNEFLLTRYDETGKARRPDYIVAENGVISERMLKHAKYFNIPIVNIERQAYAEKRDQETREILDSISEEDSFLELNGKIERIRRNPSYQRRFRFAQRVGDSVQEQVIEGQEKWVDNISSGTREGRTAQEELEIIEIEKMELRKRLEYIESEIDRIAEACEQATMNGERYYGDASNMQIIFGDSHGNGDCYFPDGSFWVGMGRQNYDYFKIELGSMRDLMVFDGAHPISTTGNYEFENHNHDNSEAFNRLKPLYERLKTAWAKNKEMWRASQPEG